MLALAAALLWIAGGAAAAPPFEDTMAQRVLACTGCHGPEGRAAADGYYPRIAGKPAGYLYNQLIAFRDGTREYPPMNYLVAYLPDSYLREMAEHFAALRPPFPQREQPPADPAMLARGQALVAQGDRQKGIPACAACHGAGLTGMNPGIPGLVGLRPTYVAAQLTRWKVGDWRAAEPDCMKRIATRLSEPDIAAVSQWLARQEPPKDPSPESSNLVRMPFACGSQR
jgi:cytochrome c553